jgi:hypothetical protein
MEIITLEFDKIYLIIEYFYAKTTFAKKADEKSRYNVINVK